MKKNLFKKSAAVLMSLTFAAGIITGCGNSDSDKAASDASDGGTVSESKGKITVAASSTPHAQILEQCKGILEEEGYELEIVEYEDYVQPNLVVDSGELDANYFQHQQYLDDFNEEKGTSLVTVAKIHYEPFGIYPGTSSSLDDIKDGAVIAVPNDTTNEARALLLLEANGIIKLKKDAGLAATVNDIAENPHNIKIEELEAAQISRVQSEVDFIVLNGNYALLAGLSVNKDALAKEAEASETAQTYANVLVVKEGNEDREDIKALESALKSDEVTKYINDTYDGSVIPID